jgi:hypothetical protein
MKRLFPDFFCPIPRETFDNIEMHENLLLNSQTFKNFIDEDEERDLAYTSFTIRTMYSRAKSGRPMTGTVKIGHGDEQYNNLDDIPESKDDMIDKNGLLDERGQGKKISKRGSNNEEKKISETGTKEITKDLSLTGGEQNVNNNEMQLQTEVNPIQTVEKDNIETKDLDQNEKSPRKDADYDNMVINSQDIKSGPNLMSDENKFAEDMHNGNDESQMKQNTEEKLIQPSEDTVIISFNIIGKL